MENEDNNLHAMELLAPAGGFEQLQAAIFFGADAVYLAAEEFGMRARAANFVMEDLPRAVEMAHSAGVRVHVACNIMCTEDDMPRLPEYFREVQASGADALIIGDIGAFALAREHAPNCELHVSTQASVANSAAARMWHSLGAKRIVCAREMSLAQIAKMRSEIPESLELEAFVHGAQCMAVSGRCLMSAYMTGRSGNRGECTQPCRWNYTLKEEKRPGQHFPIEESERGTLVFNAKDLNMVEHLREMQEAGICSLKIEGRNKKAFYVATVVGAYRRALDGAPVEEVQRELLAVSHRPYSTGFFFEEPEQAIDYDGYEQETMHVADVVGCELLEETGETDETDETDKWVLRLRCRNRFEEGQVLEALMPGVPVRKISIKDLRWEVPDTDVIQPIDVANRSCNIYTTRSDFPVPAGSFLRVREHRRTART